MNHFLPSVNLRRISAITISPSEMKKMPTNGAQRKSKILLVVCLAALCIILLSMVSWLSKELSSTTLGKLERWLNFALWLVIIGVIIEEWKLLWNIGKFIRYTWSGKFRFAANRAFKHIGEIAEGVGFTILVIGLAAELVLDPSIEGAQKAVVSNATVTAATANQKAKEAQLADDKLKARVIWRQLTSDQCAEILGGLFEGTSGTVQIAYSLGDPEALSYAIGFENCFGIGVQWQVATEAVNLQDLLPIGIFVSGRNKSELAEIEAGLTSAGIVYHVDDGTIERHFVAAFGATGTGDADINIFVGSRPIF